MVVAAVELVLALVRRDGGDRIGHLLPRDQVAAPEVDAIEPEVPRHHVEQPLAEEIGLEAAGPAISADRRLVAQLQRHVDVDIGDAIRAGHELRDVARADGAVGAHIRAHVHIGMAAQSEDRAVARAGDFHVAFGFARVVYAHQVLAPVFCPLHRAAAVARRKRNQKVLGVELAARAEAAADVVFHDLDGAFRQVHLLRERPAVEEQHLGAARNGEPPTRAIPFRQQPARLHRQRHVPLGAQALAPDVGRILECGCGIPAHRVELDREVAALVLEQERGVLRRRVAVGDRRQRLDVDLDQPERVLGDAGSVGEHDRQRLADVTHLAVRDHGLPERLEVRQWLQPHGDARHALAHVCGGDHEMHAGEPARPRNVDRADAAVGDGAAQDRRVQHALARDVVDVLPAPAQEAEIFQALDRAADERVDRSHGRCLVRSVARSLARPPARSSRR